MPGKVMVFNVLGIALQYTFLALTYYFLFRVTSMIYTDLKGTAAPKMHEPAAAARRAKLLIIQAPATYTADRTFVLGENTAIGRSEHNDIVINEAFVSHEHACITYHKKQYWLSDLASTNGTYLNAQRISVEVPLKDGDIIQIGAVTFKFER